MDMSLGVVVKINYYIDIVFDLAVAQDCSNMDVDPGQDEIVKNLLDMDVKHWLELECKQAPVHELVRE